MHLLQIAVIGAVLSVGLAPGAANAKFTLSDEAPEVAFCKSLPRPQQVTPDIDINDYCGCWVGEAEINWSQAEYNAWKTALQNHTTPSPAIAAKAKQLQEQCIGLTKPAK